MDNHQAERDGLKRLESPERLCGMPPERLLGLTGLGNGDDGPDIVDIGAGGGYFTLTAAKLTKGRVYAVDASAFMLQVLRERARDLKADNVEAVEGTAEQLPLRDDAVDVAVASLLLHILKTPEAAVKEICRVLKPGGRGLIVEWLHPREDGKPGHRVPLETMRLHLKACGVDIVREDIWADTYYSIVFRMPSEVRV